MKAQKLLLLLGFVAAMTAQADPPSGYYSSCEGLKSQALLSQLCSVVGPHTTISYDGLWDIYPDTDADGTGRIIDMYSTKLWAPSSRCGNYSNVGDCYNREHSMPKSWFSEGSPMKSDAVHVVPTDGKVNNQRSNYPYGECEGGSQLPAHNGVQPLGRLGTSTFPGYSGKVFEPDDEYKGDFARIYFYMAAAYNTRIKNWNSDMLSGNAYPAFTDWAVSLLLKWHRQDPVSQRELDRNEAVYGCQKNRNPFVDHPEMAEYIWGNQVGNAWYPGGSPTPVITLPADGSTINFGTTAVGMPAARSVVIRGANLAESVSVSSSSSAFTLSATSFTAAQANSAAGAQLTVTMQATAAGNPAGTLTITSGEARSVVSLTGTVVNGIPALPASMITEYSFVANWIDLGDEDYYTLHVCQGTDYIPGFPVEVESTDDCYFVENLEPATTYTYWLSSAAYESNHVSVTTTELIPSVQYLNDETFTFLCAPDEPSEPLEAWIEIENIDTPLTVSVPSPFQISNECSDEWAASIILDPEEDRFFVRVGACAAGEYEGSITIVAGDYSNENGSLRATVRDLSEPWFIEDFETVNEEKLDDYELKTYQGRVVAWEMDNMGIFGSDTGDAHSGDYAVRFGKRADSTLTSLAPKSTGIGTVSFWSKKWTATEADATVEVEYSADGSEWTNAGQAQVTSPDYSQFTFVVNADGNLYFRLRQSAGARIFVDDVVLTDHVSSVESIGADANGDWTAYRTHGGIEVDLAGASRLFSVYTMDGRTAHAATLAPGRTTIALPAGYYLVTDDAVSRLVLVH